MGGGVGRGIHKIRDIVTIDSGSGLMSFGSGSGRVEVSDSVFYGKQNMPNLECWDKTKQNCQC